MWDEAELAEAIRGHPLEAGAALAAVQEGDGPRLTADSLAAAADLLGRDPAELWLEQLQHRRLVDAFAAALQGQGVPLTRPEPADFADHVDPATFTVFSARAQSFRCRVLVNGKVAGSGCLIGPSLVLTAWHVVAVGPPGGPQEPAPSIRVALADSTEQDVIVPPSFASFCGDAEYDGRAPRRDADVEGRNDVAVLLMRRPAAAHLGFAGLPATAPATATHGVLFLVHYPEGADRGYGVGQLAKIRNVTARWRHDITTQGGSSGGACFDATLQLAGVHQGKWDGGGRLVPLSRFLADLRPLVAADTGPTALWSLDGTESGALVLGRDLFFEAVAAARDATGRVRGLRLKRRDVAAGGTTGLAFSHDLLSRLLHRHGAGSTLVRIGFDELVTDLVADICRRVTAAGLPLHPLPDPAGPGPVTPESAARDRTRQLAAAVEEAAAAAGRTVWFFFDNPSVALSESARLLLDGFVAAALLQPHLRLVVAGFETVALPGQEFAAPSAATGAGPPGLVVEYLGGFPRGAVLDFLARAHADLTGRPADPAVLDQIADRALTPLTSFNGIYRADDVETVVTALRADLRAWRARRGGAG
ncbi:trypsin-like serine peptidase [Geodermatophilus sp. URMC 64]